MYRPRWFPTFLLVAVSACGAARAAEKPASTVPGANPGAVWFVAPDAPPTSSSFADALRRAFGQRGVAVQEVTAGEWDARVPASGGPGDLLIILPGAEFPAGSAAKLDGFLKRGNHLLNLSRLAFAALREPLIIETLSPAYKTYPTHAASLRLPGKSVTLAPESPITIPLPRPPGYGSGVVSPLRFILIAEAVDTEGRERGAAAHLLLNTTTDYAGSIWGAVGLAPAEFEAMVPDSVALVLGMAARIREGVFLADAGPEHGAYAASEPVVCGAHLVNLGAEPERVQLSVTVTRDGRLVHDWAGYVTVPGRSVREPSHVASPGFALPPGTYRVNVRVRRRDQVVDEISGPVQVIAYAALPPREVVGISGGELVLDGRPWHPLGMNYWPHLSVGLEPKDFSRSWLSPDRYDPDRVEQDLALAEQLGLNELSIQYGDLDQARPLMDFMARAARHRLKVNIYLPALEPLRPDLPRAGRMIVAAHLRDSPALFAYDACWEGHLGGYDARRPFDARWQAWVTERYGSVAAAEADWRFAPARIAGVITGPTDEQLTHEGEWRVFVAAYRRFWDDEISRSYRRVRAAIRAVDPVHLVGARSGYGGNGTPMYADQMPFDLASGARHLDFISPEGYALAGGWNDFLKGGLTTAYARLVSGGKPVFWAEYGIPLRWQVEPQRYVPVEKSEELEPQRTYFHQMLKFVPASGANGCSGWWWPGGYRVDERSDFGIINPDGTLRPAARELQLAAREYAGRWTRPPADVFLEVDRDRYVNGYAGLYTALAEPYQQARLAGHHVGLKTGGTGTTSANTPAVAVGDVPWNGHNPPKYLNAEFAAVDVRAPGGWRRVENGADLAVPAGTVRVRVRVTNTAEAEWLPPRAGREEGAVVLDVSDDRGGRASYPLPASVPFLGEASFADFAISVAPDQPTTVELVMAASERTTFGERFRLRLSATAQVSVPAALQAAAQTR